ncbi:MAG: hypothetical protein L0Y44_05050 [Phycisphaerales bacterium]|nr:hypothetical protein [Phycisphaerales bacterium]MCI0676243.1 hypothetical protein [Phycisphaerales bacterium]
MPRRRLTIDFNIDDTLPSVTALIRVLDPMLECDDPNTVWDVDLSRCRYVGPDGAAVLLAAVLDTRLWGLQVEVTLPRDPPQLDAFCAFSGLKHRLHGEPMPDTSVPENETVPLHTFSRANFRDADPMIDLIRRHTGISKDSEDYLRISVNEVTQNVEDHSRSKIGGVSCARYLSGRREVRVAIVDCGAGIAETLRPRYPEITTGSVALQRVTIGKITALSRSNNAGLGISQLWNAIGTLGGRIFILSEDGAAENIKGTNRTIQRMDPPFPGTGVFFTLPVETSP